MRNGWIFLMMTLFGTTAWAGSIPNQITYQGTIKQQGIPVNGPLPMQFRLTNSDGTTAYWSSGNQQVTVKQGLFSTVLSPAGVDWQNVVPYIEVTVNGQVLLPREPVTATAYALISGGVIDGSITSASLASGAVTSSQLNSSISSYLIPPGLIALFTRDCPTGWARFSAMDNMFPMGGSSYGAMGGSATHAHSISSDGAHIHSLAEDSPMAGVISPQPIGLSSTGDLSIFNTSSMRGAFNPIMNTTTSSGTHNHGGATGPASSLPPYLTIVFCQKQ